MKQAVWIPVAVGMTATRVLAGPDVAACEISAVTSWGTPRDCRAMLRTAVLGREKRASCVLPTGTPLPPSACEAALYASCMRSYGLFERHSPVKPTARTEPDV